MDDFAQLFNRLLADSDIADGSSFSTLHVLMLAIGNLYLAAINIFSFSICILYIFIQFNWFIQLNFT